MSRDDFDLGPLTWVKGEIDQALASVLDQAVSYREKPQDVSPARFMLTHLHQVNGALDMVGLEGAKCFCQELESMADALVKQKLPASEEVISVFCTGVRALSAYLNDLVNGAPDIPLRLYPTYSAVAMIQGKELPDESSLFFPDTSIRAPADLPYIEKEEGELGKFILQQRRVFLKALLNWLRSGSVDDVSQMRQVAEAVAQTQRLPMNKTLWWVAGAAIDAIAQAGGKTGLQSIRIFRRLDQQLRCLLDGVAKPSGALMRDLLFQVARSPAVTERIKQVTSRFELDELLPGPELASGLIHKPGGESAALATLRHALPKLKDTWSDVAEKGVSALPSMLEAMYAIEPSREILSNGALSDLMMVLLATLERISDASELLTDEYSLDVATALTLCENALENYAYLGKEFADQAAQHISRLRQEGALAGEALPTTIDVATLSAVGHEIQGMLKQIEEVLDLYFRDPSKKDLLEPLAAPLHQVAGAFNMLELPVASSLAELCGKYVAWFAAPQSNPDAESFVSVAESLSALGYLVDDAMREGVSAEKSVALFLDELQQGAHKTDVIQGVAEVPPAKPKARRSKKVTDKAADSELLDIYLTEAEEVLETISQYVEDLREKADDPAALAEVRRGFHTLKGSGRTVGLTSMGEVAWQVEQVFNHLIEHALAPSPEVLEFAEEAQEAFSEWVSQLKTKGSVSIDIGLWQDKASSLPAQSAQPVVAEQPEPTKAPETSSTDSVVIVGGTVQIPRPLFEIFIKEAQKNLELLQDAVSNSGATPELMPAADCIRAAHTLSGISRTTGLLPVGQLAEAIELWLDAFDRRVAEWKPEGWAVMERALLSLQLMLTRVAALRKPKPDLAVLNLLQINPVVVDEPLAPSSDAEIPHESILVELPVGKATIVAPEPTSSDRQLLDIFLEEARELFPLVGAELRDWRSRPDDSAPPRSLQRALHTLKGGARMAGEGELGDAIHDLETFVIQVLKSKPLESDFDRMFADLDDISRRMEVFDTPVKQTTAGAADAPAGMRMPEIASSVVQTLRVKANVLDELVNEAGEISISRSRIEREMGMFKHSLQELTESVTRLRSYLRELEIEADSRLQSRETLLLESGEAFDPLEFDRYTRLQELTRMMAESVNDVSTTQHGLLDNLDETEAALQDQMRMNRDLQQELMHIRMIPFSTVTERLHRIVRQTARDLGNRVELSVSGAQAEIDRSVLEKIVAPLEHLLRNAIAHGIEPADQRLAAKKTEAGHIALSVRQEKNEILISVNDDGAGINVDLVRKRAIEKGLFDKKSKVDEQTLMSVIFEPGFSTSSEVTQVAGRGVGLDVVRNEISMLGGRIDVVSQKGLGTTFNIYLPTTLTMSQAVMVRAGSYQMALPAVMVEQVQVLKAETLRASYAAGKVTWSGRDYPIHYLPRLVGDDVVMPEAQRSSPVLLLRSGNYHIALHVDEIIGNREVVVKRIGQQLTLVPGIVGATVLGDGKIMLIINPVQLANRAVLAAGAVHVSAAVEVEAQRQPTVLVVDDSLTMRKVLGRLLTREGYRVLTAKDGIDALQMLQEEVPDAVVLDIEMPRMDGFELARNIRDDSQTARLPLIVVSSRTADKHRNLAKEIGIDAYLGKPVQDEALLETLAQFVAKKLEAATVN